MIEVGEYIRTPYFNIEKVERIDKAEKPIYADTVITNNTAYTMNWLLNNNVKHSKNIIDLIEVGDYVNGYKVEKIKDGYVYVDYCWDCDLYTLVTDNPDNIKTIVTKEQFEANCYKVKEE